MESAEPRERDEWRVEVALDADEQGHSLSERLHSLDLDDQARKRLGGSVIVTRDGPDIYLYAWHEENAREAERAVRELMEEDELVGQVSLVRWHPVEEAWKPADEPLPQTEGEVEAEARRHEQAGVLEKAETGEYPWQIVIDLPTVRATRDLADELVDRGLPLKRRFKYLLVGAPTEEEAIEVGRSLEGNVPDGSHVSVRGTPEGLTSPSYVFLGNLKPGILRDLGL